MRFFALLGIAAVVAASSSLEHKVEEIHVPAVEEAAPVITVIDANKTYAVKYGCAGCPFGVLKTPHAAEWIHPPPQNSLMLTLAIDKSGSALLLNDERVFPLDPLPVRISAVQVPTDLAEDEANEQAKEVMSKRIRFPLQYEHTVFRAEGNGEVWLQFNVTGLAWGEEAAPFKLGHTVLQVLLREQHSRPETPGQKGCDHALSIASVQVVEEKNRVQPPRMKCGRLAMIRTAFDPNEWDDYGKFGTWARTWNVAIGKLGALWSGSSQSNLLLPLSLLLAASILVARCIWQLRQQIQAGGDSAAESWLLGCHAPPAYADIPVIKIEQYD